MELNFLSDGIAQLWTYNPKSPLIFSSGLFLFVFLGFVAFYQFFRRAPILRMIYVILFSLYFYFKSSGIYFVLLVGVATSDFLIARALAAAQQRKFKRLWLWLSIALNLGLLGYFKYTNFFIGIANDLAGGHFLDFRNIFLPVGISFFLFQSMSYIIDIYRDQLKPLHNWLDYLFYLSFFPVLLAGPIIRARDFIPQIRQNPIRVTREMFGTGVFFIIAGLFKKAVISDYISLNFVDRIFDAPLLYSGFENLMGVYGYALQIYCDFSGYSDMAIGIALILGFRFPLNFRSPYKSATITEFWRRWHISLSTWLRDYLYISLGGNRKGRFRTYVNLLITMFLGGLWHGAALRFVLWGALHGVALAVHKWIMSLSPRVKATGEGMKRGWRIAGIVFTFHLVCLGWILFRAPDMATCGVILSQIFTHFNAGLIPDVVEGYGAIFGLMLLGYVLHLLPDSWETWSEQFVTRMPLVVKAMMIVVVIWIVMQIKSSEIQPFIYFQF